MSLRTGLLEEHGKTVTVLAILVIVGACAFVWRATRSPVPKINRAPFLELGQVLAEETAKAVSNHGRVVAVITDAHRQSGTPTHAEWEAFSNELKKHKSIELM